MDRQPISGWVPADVAERLSDVRREPLKFNETDEEHLHDIVPDRLIKPLASLMQTRMELNAARRSFGTINQDRALEWYEKNADSIHEALEMLWSEL